MVALVPRLSMTYRSGCLADVCLRLCVCVCVCVCVHVYGSFLVNVNDSVGRWCVDMYS